MHYNRFLPLITPFLAWLFSEMYIWMPRMVYVAVLLVLLVFFFTSNQFVRPARPAEKWWNYFLLPSFYFVGATAFFTLIPNSLLVQILLVFNSVILYWYFRTIYYRFYNPALYKKSQLENLSSYCNYLALYFIASAIYGFQAFLDMSVWILMVLLVVASAALLYQLVWAYGLMDRLSLFYVLIGSLLMVELAWPITFLPLSFYISGLMLSIYYYILAGILRYYLARNLTQRIVKLYLTYGFLSILAVLFTARWL